MRGRHLWKGWKCIIENITKNVWWIKSAMALTFDYSRVNNARFAKSDLQINKKRDWSLINFQRRFFKFKKILFLPLKLLWLWLLAMPFDVVCTFFNPFFVLKSFYRNRRLKNESLRYKNKLCRCHSTDDYSLYSTAIVDVNAR